MGGTVIAELISVLAIFVGGCAAVRTAGVRGWVLPAFGWLAGVCLLLAVGLVQVVTPLPTTPVLTVAVVAGAPLLWWAVRWWRRDDVGIPVRYAVLGLAGLAALVAVGRMANLAKWHTDSFRYLMAGSLIADGEYATGVSTHMLTKRSLGLPLLHAPAHLGGDYYLRSVHALLALATLLVLVWFLRRGLAGRVTPAALSLFTGLGLLLLLTNNRFVFSAFYLNGHLLTAVLVLVIAGCGALLATRDRPPRDAPARALLVLQVLAIPALVIVRPESPVLAGLALLPTWLSGRIPVRHRMLTAAVLGAATALWQGFGVWIHLERGAPVPREIAATLALGVLLLAALPVLRWPLLPRRAREVLWTVEIGLWLALLAFTVRDPQILVDSLRATFENVVGGGSYWGLSLVVLALLFGAALLARVAPLRGLRFPVTTFVPLALLLAYLRDEPYRVGYGDSLNRMLMHMVPLAVWYVTAALATRAEPAAPEVATAAPADAAAAADARRLP